MNCTDKCTRCNEKKIDVNSVNKGTMENNALDAQQTVYPVTIVVGVPHAKMDILAPTV